MSEAKLIINPSGIDPLERKRRLAKVYALILSWPDPLESNSEPTVTVLGRERTVDPEDSLTHSDTAISRSDSEKEILNGQELSEL